MTLCRCKRGYIVRKKRCHYCLSEKRDRGDYRMFARVYMECLTRNVNANVAMPFSSAMIEARGLSEKRK